jgi:XTP/dITP diphosphohydrolase
MTFNGPVVLATRNNGKILEFRELLAQFRVELRGIGEFPPIPDVVEDGETFQANAIKKARFAAEKLGLAALADDSGLVVPALGGAPGVYSSRYAGENAGDADNIRKLLKEMRDVSDRSAYFVCVIALAVPGGGTRLYRGSCNGIITLESVGKGGFGYDPVFYYPPLAATFAEIDRKEKNEVSHRGEAMLALRGDFDLVLGWLASSFKNVSADH